MVYDLSPGLRSVFLESSCVSCAVVCQFLFFLFSSAYTDPATPFTIRVRVCSLSTWLMAAPPPSPCDSEDESATSPAPSTAGSSHDGASLCATKSLGAPTVSRRDAPAVSRGRPRWTSTAASRQPALHMPKVAACETCQRPVSVLAATMPARRAKHVTTPMPVGRTQEGGVGWVWLRVEESVCMCVEVGCGGGVASSHAAAAAPSGTAAGCSSSVHGGSHSHRAAKSRACGTLFGELRASGGARGAHGGRE